MNTLLVNRESRTAMLEYLSQGICTNEKRAQMQVEENLVASDGIMCNLLFILQGLSLPVSNLYPLVRLNIKVFQTLLVLNLKLNQK